MRAIAAGLVVGVVGLLQSVSPIGGHALPWPLDDQHLRAAEVWQKTRGSGVVVAVVDSGVDGAHADLFGQLLPGVGFVGMTGDNGWNDVSGDSHGTSIAAIIAGSGKGAVTGLAPDAKVLPVRVTVSGGAQPVTLAEGILYAVDHGAKVVNVSSGTDTPDPNLKAAVEHALAKDVVVVAAAGNDGRRGNAPIYPASFPGVVAVTGVDAHNACWSDSESGPQIALAAPGVDITSADDHGGYLRGDGTSYAAPYVAAAAALVRSEYPRMTAGQVVRQLVDTADRVGSAPHDDHFGYGIVDPLRAVTAGPTTDSGLPTATVAVGPWINWPLWGGVAGVVAVLAAAAVLVRRKQSRGKA